MLEVNYNTCLLRQLLISLAGVVLLTLSFNLLAQEPDSIQLKSVIVSAEKPSGIPAMKSVEIDSDILDNSQTQSIGAILTKHSSITIKNYGPSGIQTPTFRGMSASHTKIYLNGLDISPGSLGQSDLSIIPSFLFDGVSLKFGNTAFTEGPGGIGGGVMLDANPKLNEMGSSAIVGLSYGSFDSKTINIQYGYKTKKFQSITRYILQDAKNDFEYRNIAQPYSPIVNQEHSEKALQGFSQSFKYQLNAKNQLTALVLGTVVKRNLPTLMTDTKPSQQSQNDEMINTQLGWAHYEKQSKSNLVMGYSWSSLNYVDDAANINSTTINKRFQIREDYTLNLNTNWALKTTGLLDYSTANNVNLSGSQDMLQTSVLVGVNGHLSKKWETGIFIQPTLNRTDFELLPMISLAFLPTEKKNVIIGFNVAQNVHFPTLNDLYWTPGGNPNLFPEKALNGELNLHLGGEMKKKLKWDFDMSTFYGSVDNWVLWQPSDKAYWEAQNIKSVQHSGGEITLGLKRCLGEFGLALKGSYQLVNAINKGIEGESLDKQLIYTPQNSANWMVDVKFRKFWLSTNYVYTGKRFITSSNSSYLPAYDFVNVSLKYPFTLGTKGYLEVQLDINNVFGKEYMSVAYRAMPATNYMLSVKYRFKNKSKSYNKCGTGVWY